MVTLGNQITEGNENVSLLAGYYGALRRALILIAMHLIALMP